MVSILDKINRKITVGQQVYPQRLGSLQLRPVGQYTEARLLIRGTIADICSNDPSNAAYYQNSIFGKTTPGEVLTAAQGNIPIDAYPFTQAISQPAAQQNGNFLSTIGSIFENLATVDPTLFPKILAEGYWSAGDGAGGILIWNATSTALADGGRVFASSFSVGGVGRWHRMGNRAATVVEYGAQPLREFIPATALDYSYGGLYPEKTLAQAPQLSTRFANLAAAQTWYPHVFSLAQTIDHAAIQEALEHNSRVEIPEGSYLCRHPIKIARKRWLSGGSMRNTILKFVDCAGFVPRTRNVPGDLSYAYTETAHFSNFSLIGNWVTGQPFDETRSGIRFPRNFPVETYSDTAPLGALMFFQNIEVSGFAGHGIQWMEIFCSQFTNCSSKGNAGHQVFSIGGNSFVLRNFYAAEVSAGYSGFRIYGNALLDSCTGTDSYEAWWGHFGATLAEDGINASASIMMINCNVERQNKCLRIVNGGSLRVIGGQIQAYLTSQEPYMIFDEGYGTKITLSSVTIFSISSVLAVAQVKNFGANGGSSGRYLFDRCVGDTGDQIFKSIHFDSNGSNIFGPGVTIDCPRIDVGYLDYATFGNSFSALRANKLYFGGGATPVAILSGEGSPEGTVQAPRGSSYTDVSTGTPYVKRTTEALNTGWKAYTLAP